MQQLKIIQDRYGRLWLGPENTDPNEDLAAQGCWRCGIPFPIWRDHEEEESASESNEPPKLPRKEP